MRVTFNMMSKKTAGMSGMGRKVPRGCEQAEGTVHAVKTAISVYERHLPPSSMQQLGIPRSQTHKTLLWGTTILFMNIMGKLQIGASLMLQSIFEMIVLYLHHLYIFHELTVTKHLSQFAYTAKARPRAYSTSNRIIGIVTDNASLL